MAKKTVQIRDMDPDLWADMKAEAAKRKVTMRDLVLWLWRTRPELSS